MKKTKNIAIICAVTGVCVLTTAALASYQTANGYDTLKKSILNTIDYKNCTVSAGVKMNFDGTELMNGSFIHKFDSDNKMSYTKSTESGVGSSGSSFESYNANDYRYYLDSDNYFVKYPNSYSEFPQNLWGIDNADRKTVDKVVRFMELAADTVVGDLRNNFVCTEDADDHASYSLTLDSVQIPEIVNAGLSMVFSMSNNASGSYMVYDDNGNQVEYQYTEDDLQYYTSKLGNDPVVDTLNLNYSVNKDGTFRDGNMTVIFRGTDSNGASHDMTFDINLGISDIGTTSITPVEETGAVIKTYDDEGNLVDVK